MSDLELVWRSWRALSRLDRRRSIETLRSHCAEERATVLRRNGSAVYGVKAAYYLLAAKRSHFPGSPFNSYEPRSENFRSVPATRSVTTRETNTSLLPDCDITRAAAWTAMPPMSLPLISTSPQ